MNVMISGYPSRSGDGDQWSRERRRGPYRRARTMRFTLRTAPTGATTSPDANLAPWRLRMLWTPGNRLPAPAPLILVGPPADCGCSRSWWGAGTR